MRNSKKKKMLVGLLGNVDVNGYVLLDGEMSKRIGKILSEFGIRERVLIAYDRRTRKTVMIDVENALRELI